MADVKVTPLSAKKYGFLQFEQPDRSQEKKAYASELRVQIEEQKKARLKEKEDYKSSPVVQKKLDDGSTNKPVAKKLDFNIDNVDNVEEEDKENLTSVNKIDRQPLLFSSPYAPYQYPYYGHGGFFPPYVPSFYPGYLYPYSSPQRPILLPDSNVMPEISNYDPYLHYGIDRMNLLNGIRKSPEPARDKGSPRPTKRTSYISSLEARSINNIGSTPTSTPKKMDASQYYNDLQSQIAENNARKLKLKEQEDAYNRKIEAEAESYSPWGKGGSGAPLKKIVSSNSPEINQKTDDINEAREQRPKLKSPSKEPNKKVDSPVQTNFGRVNEITGDSKEKDPAIIAAKIEYQSYLRRQIEEREAQKSKEKEIKRLEEEQEAERIEKERELLKIEYERDVAERKRKDEMYKKINEDLKRQCEERQRMKKLEDSIDQSLQPIAAISWNSPRIRESPPLPTYRSSKNFLSSPKSKSPEKLNELQTSLKESPQKALDNLPLNISIESISPVPVDKYKEHVMKQLSALRVQLNRLQEIKEGKNMKNSYFDTRLSIAAKQRSHKRNKSNDVLLTDLEEPSSGKVENLDNQSTSDFMVYSPQPKISPGQPEQSYRGELLVPDIQRSNQQRLRRLERDMENSLNQRSPTQIIDEFLMNKTKRSNSEVSILCETTFKPI